MDNHQAKWTRFTFTTLHQRKFWFKKNGIEKTEWDLGCLYNTYQAVQLASLNLELLRRDSVLKHISKNWVALGGSATNWATMSS